MIYKLDGQFGRIMDAVKVEGTEQIFVVYFVPLDGSPARFIALALTAS